MAKAKQDMSASSAIWVGFVQLLTFKRAWLQSLALVPSCTLFIVTAVLAQIFVLSELLLSLEPGQDSIIQLLIPYSIIGMATLFGLSWLFCRMRRTTHNWLKLAFGNIALSTLSAPVVLLLSAPATQGIVQMIPFITAIGAAINLALIVYSICISIYALYTALELKGFWQTLLWVLICFAIGALVGMVIVIMTSLFSSLMLAK